MATKMKKITVKSNFHTGSEATFFVPEWLETTHDAMEWLEGESWWERSRLGFYDTARAKQLRIKRQLCGIKGCMCGVVKEEI